jgi:hypothetical protein
MRNWIEEEKAYSAQDLSALKVTGSPEMYCPNAFPDEFGTFCLKRGVKCRNPL